LISIKDQTQQSKRLISKIKMVIQKDIATQLVKINFTNKILNRIIKGITGKFYIKEA
jgi:hypothetical protein